MKANELRLKNIVAYNGITGYVDWIQDDSITINYLERQSDMSNGAFVSPNRIEGIPLNEGWLLKFGFDTYQICFYKNGFTVGWFAGDVFIHLPTGSLSSSGFGTPLINVHQLQNLYFALTGEELVRR